MKILVTGGAGYIGSVMVPAMLKKGHEVTVIDNFMYNQTPLLECCIDKRLNIVRGDARDKDIVRKELKAADAVFPLACLTGAPLCATDSTAARSTNLDAVKMILKLKSKHQLMIFPTTNSGYGIGEKGKYCIEKTPLRPVSFYGKLKVEAEDAILQKGNAITLRLATAFGTSPRMRLDLLVNDFVYRAINDHFVVLFEPHFKRNYIHVSDVARAFIHCLDNFRKMEGEPYNVGLSDANLSKWELCEQIKKELPDFHFSVSDVGKDPDKRDYIVSNAKIEKTGFRPQVSLAEGIRELIKGCRIVKRNQFANI